MRYQLLDVRTSEVVVESDSLDAVAEVKAELRDDGMDVDELVLLTWEDGDDHPSLVE